MRALQLLPIASLSVVLSLAACGSDPTAAIPPSFSLVDEGGNATSTVRWNEFARALIVTAKPNQQEALRALTYLSLAQHQSLIPAAHPTTIGDVQLPNESVYQPPTLIEGPIGGSAPRTRTAIHGAIAGASAKVLTALFPAHAAAVDAELAAERGRAADAGENMNEFDRGVAKGSVVGERVAVAAAADGYNLQWTGEVPTGVGVWFSSIGKPPALPLFGKVRTFYMTSGDQFRAPPPPAFGSQAFNAALAEIRTFSDTRTQAQDSIAKFWAMATGTLAAGYWNEVAVALIAKYHLTEVRAAHVLALMNTAAMDGNIACHDTKYTYWVMRPSQADPSIKTAIGLPNHPSYPSNHSCLSGTAAIILGEQFPAERAEMERQSAEATLSRYYAGLHYRFDGEAGLAIARQVGALAIARDRSLNGRLELR